MERPVERSDDGRRRSTGRQGEADHQRQRPHALGDRALAPERALVQQPDPVGALLHLIGVAGGEEDRGPVVAQPMHGVPERIAGVAVQSGGGVVEDHELGPAAHGGGEVEASLLAIGQL